jgi:hypothetical protein
MAETVEAEVIPPDRSARPINIGFMRRPGFAFFTTGVLTGMILAGIAIYVVKKKL